jgi:hypothetical protein
MIQFKDLPVEIQQRMLDEQERQGNPRNAEVFEKDIMAGARAGAGFFWVESVEGYAFWEKIIMNGDFSVFYAKYPKSPRLKVIPLHIKVLNSKALLEDIAEKLLKQWHDEGQPAKVEIDWFEHGGFYWSATAEIEAEYEVRQYGYFIPPDSYCKGMSVTIGAIKCTDEEGNPVLVDYFDDERTQIREDDFVRKVIIDMEMEGN